MATLAEKLKEAQSRSMREIAENDATEQGGKKKKKPAQKPKPKPKEDVGTGRDFASENAERLIAQVRDKLKATSDPAKRADLEARIKALKASASE